MIDDAEYAIPDDHVQEHPPGVAAGGPNAESPPDLPRTGQKKGRRTDRGRLHAMRDSPSSRGLLETLCKCGENRRSVRRMEAELRAELKPAGPLERLLVDQLWSCILRLILLSHLEE
jgi:hypothetical protein